MINYVYSVSKDKRTERVEIDEVHLYHAYVLSRNDVAVVCSISEEMIMILSVV